MELTQLQLLKDESFLSLDAIGELRKQVPTQINKFYILGEIRALLFLCFGYKGNKAGYVIFDKTSKRIIYGPRLFSNAIIQRIGERIGDKSFYDFVTVFNRFAGRYDIPEIENATDYTDDGALYSQNTLDLINTVFSDISKISNEHNEKYYTFLFHRIFAMTSILCKDHKCKNYEEPLDYEIVWEESERQLRTKDGEIYRRYVIHYSCQYCGTEYEQWIRLNEYPPKNLRNLKSLLSSPVYD